MDNLPDQQAEGSVYVERPGPGPVLVMLHGIGARARSFQPLWNELPRDLHLLAWNAPGYGGSDPLKPGWPVAADYAAALHDWLRALGHDRVHLMGHSLGTLIAAAFAQAHPGMLASLTLTAAAQGYGIPQGGEMPPKVAARITEIDRLGPAEFARTRAPRLVYRPEANPAVVARVEQAMAAVDPGGYAQAVRMLASGDLSGTLAGQAIRPGFVIGAEDVVTPAEQTRNAAAAWQRAGDGTRPAPEIHSIPDAGHALYVQCPRAFAGALGRVTGLWQHETTGLVT